VATLIIDDVLKIMDHGIILLVFYKKFFWTNEDRQKKIEEISRFFMRENLEIY